MSGTMNENWSNLPFLTGFQGGNGMNIFNIPEYKGKDIREMASEHQGPLSLKCINLNHNMDK